MDAALQTFLDALLAMEFSEADQARYAREWDKRSRKAQAGDPKALTAGLGVGTIRKMGGAGDAPATFPTVLTLDRAELPALLERIAPAEAWAMQQTAITIRGTDAKRRHGEQVYVVGTPDGRTMPTGTDIQYYDPTEQGELVITFPLQGGI